MMAANTLSSRASRSARFTPLQDEVELQAGFTPAGPQTLHSKRLPSSHVGGGGPAGEQSVGSSLPRLRATSVLTRALRDLFPGRGVALERVRLGLFLVPDL